MRSNDPERNGQGGEPLPRHPRSRHSPKGAREDRLLDDMLGAPTQREEAAPANPSAARDRQIPSSEPTSKKPSRTAEGTAKPAEERPSVRKGAAGNSGETAEGGAAAAREEPAKSTQEAAAENHPA